MCSRYYKSKPGRIFSAVVLALAAVFAGQTPAAARVEAVATTGMVADLVRAVGGDRVEVAQLMGPGVDPHLYKPTSGDAARLSGAGAIFYNGLHLEGRMAGLFGKLAGSGRPVVALGAAIPAERLLRPEGFDDHHDPHIWLDPGLWALTVPAVVEGLAAADPAGRGYYEERGRTVEAELAALDAWCREMAAKVPPGDRILVTSHDAFAYFGRAYGFKVVGLQGVSTVSEAALADVASLVDFLREKKVRAIFVESSVNPAAIRRVADDAGVAVGGELFSDAMGAPGEMKDGFDTGTYAGMVKFNMSAIIRALTAPGDAKP